MEYNTNTYLTISHSNCEALGLGDTHRTNNTGDTCILEYPTVEEIPTEVAEVMLATYTHQEALALVETAEWVTELPL